MLILLCSFCSDGLFVGGQSFLKRPDNCTCNVFLYYCSHGNTNSLPVVPVRLDIHWLMQKRAHSSILHTWSNEATLGAQSFSFYFFLSDKHRHRTNFLSFSFFVLISFPFRVTVLHQDTLGGKRKKKDKKKKSVCGMSRPLLPQHWFWYLTVGKAPFAYWHVL